jgi:putative ABC transport system permease protein
MPHPLFYCAGSNQVRRTDEEQNTFEEGFTFADQSILDILQVPMIYGDRKSALNEPNTMVISKRKADKYFPNQNPVGKTMILNNDNNRIYKIGGVIEDFPSTSHIHYDFMLTMTGYQLWDNEQPSWESSNYYTYVLLKPGADAALFQNKLKLIITKYYVPMMKQGGNVEAEDFAKKVRLLAQPIADCASLLIRH